MYTAIVCVCVNFLQGWVDNFNGPSGLLAAVSVYNVICIGVNVRLCTLCPVLEQSLWLT